MMGWHGQGKCHDDKKSIILDKLVDLLSVLIFNFNKNDDDLDDDGMAWTGQVSRR